MLLQEKRQIAICVTTVLMVGWFVLLDYMPVWKRMNSVKKSRTAQKRAIERVATKKGQIPKLEKQLEQLRLKVENYEKQIPKDRNLGDFLQMIADLMTQQGLREQLIEPGSEVKEGKLQCIPVTMKCKGNLEQLFEFYNLLQNMDRLVRIEDVKLVNESNFSGDVSMHTNAVIYYRMEAGKG
ncbi:MAG: type IV pilus inner membrane component PilO [Planctomycetota bacterium]|jgi:Tfp pilus assembly protein PilO